MEIREVKMKQIDQACPLCQAKNNDGWMRPTGIVISGNTPQYEHKCTKCAYKQTYTVRFPYIVQ